MIKVTKLRRWQTLKKDTIDYTLYVCTDRGIMSTKTIEESVEQAILGGSTVIQLREKDCSSKEFYHLAKRIKEITSRYQIPFLINDRVDIALAVDADGVHVGQSDLPVSVVRHLLGKDKVIGASAHNVEEAKRAVDDGADYLGVGAIAATNTKDASRISIEEVKAIRREVSVPVVAIGGICKDNISLVKETGVNGIAVISAILAKENITQAAKEMVEEWKR